MADFDFKMDLNELSLEDIAAWPLIVRAVLIFSTCMILFFCFYMLDTKRQLKSLKLAHATEVKLKQSFEEKQKLAANLEKYQVQLGEIKKNLGALLTKLPDQTEVPGLLEDISLLGTSNGLKFTLFKPLPEKQHDYYAQLPIKIQMKGSYHEFSQFVCDVAKLDRIVTFDDYIIQRPQTLKQANDKSNAQKIPDENLSIDLTAHTYRYNQKVQK